MPLSPTPSPTEAGCQGRTPRLRGLAPRVRCVPRGGG
jgi:hypothetical protein